MAEDKEKSQPKTKSKKRKLKWSLFRLRKKSKKAKSEKAAQTSSLQEECLDEEVSDYEEGATCVQLQDQASALPQLISQEEDEEEEEEEVNEEEEEVNEDGKEQLLREEVKCAHIGEQEKEISDQKSSSDQGEQSKVASSSRQVAEDNRGQHQLLPNQRFSGILEEDINLMAWLRSGNVSAEAANLLTAFLEWRCAFTHSLIYRRRRAFPASLFRAAALRAATARANNSYA